MTEKVAEPMVGRTYLTVKEAAVLLGFSAAFVYQLVARSELPVVRFGRKAIRIEQSALEQWLKQLAERGNVYNA